MHLGHDPYSQGSVHPQLQEQRAQRRGGFRHSINWAAREQAGDTTATVNLVDAQGLAIGLCIESHLAFRRCGDGRCRAGNSPADGYWAGGKQAPFRSWWRRSGRSVEGRVTAGTCNGTSDLDDFEINRLRVYFSSTELRAINNCKHSAIRCRPTLRLIASAYERCIDAGRAMTRFCPGEPGNPAHQSRFVLRSRGVSNYRPARRTGHCHGLKRPTSRRTKHAFEETAPDRDPCPTSTMAMAKDKDNKYDGVMR